MSHHKHALARIPTDIHRRVGHATSALHTLDCLLHGESNDLAVVVVRDFVHVVIGKTLIAAKEDVICEQSVLLRLTGHRVERETPALSNVRIAAHTASIHEIARRRVVLIQRYAVRSVLHQEPAVPQTILVPPAAEEADSPSEYREHADALVVLEAPLELLDSVLKQRCRPVSHSVHICNRHVLELVGSEETNGLPAVFGALTVVARLSLHIALHVQICIDRTIRILYALTPLPYSTLMGFASLSVVFIPTILFSVSVATRIE